MTGGSCHTSGHSQIRAIYLNTVFQTYGFCAVTFEIGGEMISGDAIVANIPGCQVMIGMDLLEDLDCSIEVASKKLIVGKIAQIVQ